MSPSGTTFARVKRHCLSFEGTSERLSHGHPAIFAGKQGAMVETDPEAYFVPPYVGHRGWLGVRLDRGLDWNEIAGALEDAYAEVAAK